MMETVFLAAGIIGVCFVGFGVGVFFFGRAANRESCGSVPHVEASEYCPSRNAGLCPVEDLSGTVKMAKRAQISYHKANLTD